MNKRGFELSINFIVTLILAIVILSFGIYFIKMIYEKSTEMKLTLDQQTEIELERLMDSGEKVSVYPGRRTVSNGEMAKFGLGVLNINDVPTTDFNVIIKPSTAIDKDGTEFSSSDLAAWKNDAETNWIKTTYTPNPTEFTETIKNNEKKKNLIGITPFGDSGETYVFNVDVFYDKNEDGSIEQIDEEKYDYTHKIYVKVS